MKLLYAAPSPYSRKVRVMARELGLASLIEEVPVVTTPVAPAAVVSAANPLSKIPTLLLPDGSALFDSRVICEYLEHLAQEAGHAQAPKQGLARFAILRRQALADGLLDAALLHRYETVLRPKELHWPAWLEAQLGKVHEALARLASDVPIIGPVLTVDAAAVASALGWLEFRMPELEWRKNQPPLGEFYDEVSGRASMDSTQP